MQKVGVAVEMTEVTCLGKFLTFQRKSIIQAIINSTAVSPQFLVGTFRCPRFFQFLAKSKVERRAVKKKWWLSALFYIDAVTGLIHA